MTQPRNGYYRCFRFASILSHKSRLSIDIMLQARMQLGCEPAVADRLPPASRAAASGRSSSGRQCRARLALVWNAATTSARSRDSVRARTQKRKRDRAVEAASRGPGGPWRPCGGAWRLGVEARLRCGTAAALSGGCAGRASAGATGRASEGCARAVMATDPCGRRRRGGRRDSGERAMTPTQRSNRAGPGVRIPRGS